MDTVSHQNRWNQIAWNGISFYKPDRWEIATIGQNYLMIGSLRHPQMELTWEVAGKRPLFPQDIKKRQFRIFKQHLTGVDVWTPFTDWTEALSAYEITGFFWKRPETMCFGVIVSCTSCNRVSLIQFFQNADESNLLHDIAPRVLASFRDHTNGNDQQWAVYDIRMTLPGDFRVKSYRFSPGFIEMLFLSQNQQIRFYRWSPASVLLSNRNLIDFAELMNICPDGNYQNAENAHRIEWERIPSVGLWNGFIAFLSGRFSYMRVLIRHDPANNRVLAITAESRQMMNSSHLDCIFSSYEISAT